MNGPDPTQYGWWLASRSAGIVALGLVTVSVLLGLFMAGKVMRRPGLAPRLMALHQHTALAGLIAIAVHGIALLGDRWLNPGVRGVTVPFLMDYRPGFTGVGIVAAYLAALLGLSFYARRAIGPRLWRKAHRLTVVVYALAVVHTLGAGTDAGNPVLQIAMLATGVPILALLAYRMIPRGRRQRPPRPAPQRA